jgi:hypothetical protein
VVEVRWWIRINRKRKVIAMIDVLSDASILRAGGRRLLER